MATPCGPFVGAEAVAARTLGERALRREYAPLYPGVYLRRGLEPSAKHRAEAAWLWSKRRGVVAGLSAAALLDTKWIDGRVPAELVHDNRRPPPMLVVRSDRLIDGETIDVDGIPATSPVRTAFDIGRHTAGRVSAVQRLDALANATSVRAVDVLALADAHPGARGLRRLRSVLQFVDGGAESPQETIARLALVDAGLPPPTTQFEVFDRYGFFVARLDMAYEAVLVGIEYDGPQHWTDPAVRQHDIDRQFALAALGWNVIRVSRDLLRYRRATYVARVEEAARARGMLW